MIPRFSHVALELTAEHFDDRTFKRGIKYAAENRVKLVKSTWPAVAKVRGTQSYVVTVNYAEDRALMWSECSCPVRHGCKHAAATALQVFQLLEGDMRANRERYRAEAVGEWLSALGRKTAEPTGADEPTSNKRVLYVLSGELSEATLELFSTTVLKRGGFGKLSPIRRRSYEARDMPSWLTKGELRLSISCRAYGERSFYESGMDAGRLGAALLEELASTGMLFWKTLGARPLAWGQARAEEFSWQPIEGEPDEYRLSLDAGLRMIGGEELLYVDPQSGTIGPLDIGIEAGLITSLFEGPAVPESMLPTAEASLLSLLQSEKTEKHQGSPQPQPSLLVSLGGSGIEITPRAFYEGHTHKLGEWQDFTGRGGDDGTLSTRDMVAEGRFAQRWQSVLHEADLQLDFLDNAQYQEVGPRVLKTLAHEIMPMLMAEGWHCEFDEGVPAKLPLLDAEFVEELAPMSDGHDWFSLGLGVNIAGKTVPLLPLLLQALRSGKIDLSASQFSATEGLGVNLELDDGTLVHVSGPRLQRWVRPLVELNLRGLNKEKELVMPGVTALDLAGDLPERHLDGKALEKVRKQLAALLDLQPKDPPKTFVGTLRTYQKEGLAWLHFLHADGYGGLLADDMGLGKTVQVLAFIEGLRSSRKLRAKTPVLVVAPRSVVGNWQSETKRFVPKLKSKVHLGADRAKDLEGLTQASLLITSYQTLLRDMDLFMEMQFTSIFFDEAQALKNPDTKLRRAVARLGAQSRFCVTGTPIENHLGELWSQMDLAMPGILGNRKAFSVIFRKPIEKYGESRALDLMRQRIRPFMLRRTKGDVDIDLPEKTEIVERVPLGTAQRDLYESLRLILDKKVRKALAEKGVSGSSLIILDALTRLRQCCCDPSLVKTPAAAKVKTSAKLERLMVKLEELADAGRFTLVFSQFTSMLALVEEQCKAAGIGYVKLTGRTVKREKVIEQFQSGSVPVFLISLKAGGVGLNLTRADTVIHYDPWWNPAAENQATDRAHRIGQRNRVMVYKLVAEATLEEQILLMQEQKQKLTDSALKEGGLSHLGAEDLRSLFQSLS
ncbi:MAG: DEAD/DEAH box helicase [Myxococcales bacterium]|nr:DEAD/DEAH box helicase [Myxococcales bacterium]